MPREDSGRRLSGAMTLENLRGRYNGVWAPMVRGFLDPPTLG